MAKLFLVQIGQYLAKPDSGVYQKTMAIYHSFSKRWDVKIVGFGRGTSKGLAHIDWHNCEGLNVWDEVDHWMTSNISVDDVVLFRYPFGSSALLNLMQRWGGQIIFEHNTKEENEAVLTQKRAWKASKIQFSRSFLLYTWNTWVTSKTDESLFGAEVLSYALGGVCVTHEIANYEASRFSGYSTFVLPNGIDSVSNVIKTPEWNRRDLKVVMIIGSFSPWHGIERVVKSIDHIQRVGIHVELDIIGLNDISLFEVQDCDFFKVKFLGIRSDQEIENLMSNYHIAIGSLGLHRIGLNEACPLKVREYWSCGLPVILSYQDTACIEHPEMSDWIVQLASDESPIDWQRVKDYLDELYLKPNWKNQLIVDADRFLKYDTYLDRFNDFVFQHLKRNRPIAGQTDF
jgi:glycosyltransferase involved in cell wall biosynthesis